MAPQKNEGVPVDAAKAAKSGKLVSKNKTRLPRKLKKAQQKAAAKHSS